MDLKKPKVLFVPALPDRQKVPEQPLKELLEGAQDIDEQDVVHRVPMQLLKDLVEVYVAAAA